MKPIINGSNKEQFTNYIVEGKTIPELMIIYKCSRSAINTAKRRYELIGISPNSRKRDSSEGSKTCNICIESKSLDEFYSNGYNISGTKRYKPSCKTCEALNRKTNWYSFLKNELLLQNREYKCELCGYDKNVSALNFHHVSGEKNFEISSIGKTTRHSKDIGYELSICAILCSNCHAEFHNPTLNKDIIWG